MKCTSFSIFLLISYTLAIACHPASPANITWKENPLNAGTISYGSTKSMRFECINPGETPVQIKAVYPGCDCTIVDSFTQLSIKPGERGLIWIHYDTHKGIIGPMRKNLFVITEGTPDSVSTLYYTGTVTGTK